MLVSQPPEPLLSIQGEPNNTVTCPFRLNHIKQHTKPHKQIPLIERADFPPKQHSSQLPGPSLRSSLDAASPEIRAEPPRAPLVSLATPPSDVSAFCRAVLSNLIPNRFWGEGSEGQENKDVVMGSIDRFVRLRRFENLSLHAVFQGLKVENLPI